MDPKLIGLYDAYTEGRISRRAFMLKLAALVGGMAAANALAPLFESNYALAAIVPANDSRLSTEYVTFPGANGTMRAYLARTTNQTAKSGVLVIHENRGLNPHIEDVARRVALEGYVALAPDALAPLGGTPEDPDKARDMIGQLNANENLQNFLAATAFLKTYTGAGKKIGCMGFCWGGGLANQLAVHSPDLSAVVPYYGRQAATEDVPKIKAALLLHYAGDDSFINPGIKPYEEALKAAGVDYSLYMYPGALHAFNNDTNASRYNKAAADLAWQRTFSFFKAKL